MLREVFASKSLIAALIGCGLVIVGIHFWSQHEHSKLRRDEAETRRFIQQVERGQTASLTRTEEPDLLSPPQEVTNNAQDAHRTSTPVPETIPAPAAAVAVAESLEEEGLAQEEVTLAEPPRVSLFGFGVYPDIPPDFPEQDVWERIEELYQSDAELAEDCELMARVQIKLWKQGLHSVGASRDRQTGLIYPHYPNTAYVRWAWDVDENGHPIRYAAGVKGGADLAQYNHYFAEGEIPPHITVIDYEDAGIDPYQFLDFQH